MKKTLMALVAAATLSACATEEPGFTEHEAGAMIFGAAAVAICAQSGICAFPL